MKQFLSTVIALGFSSMALFAGEKRTINYSNFNTFQISDEGSYSNYVKMNNREDTGTIKIVNIQSQKLDEALPIGVIVNEGKPDLKLFWGVMQKQLTAGFQLPLYYKENEIIYKINAFALEIEEEKVSKIVRKDYIQNSVLSTGNWYKFAVEKRGIYKIDYNFLQSLGLNPASINPANIRIYGNGGQEMLEQVTDGAFDDLVENKIEVVSSGSSFGANDYILLYATGPLKWTSAGNGKDFVHRQNSYEDKSYYFITVDQGPGQRISAAPSITGSPTVNINKFNDYALVEIDTINLGRIGKQWFGHRVPRNGSIDIPFNLYTVSDTVRIAAVLGGIVESGQISCIFKQGNTTIGTANIFQNSGDYSHYKLTNINTQFIPNAASFNINVQSNANSINAVTYLDYIRLNYKRPLQTINGQQLQIRSFEQSAANNSLVAFNVNLANANTKVWDVTNPLSAQLVNVNISANTLNFIDSGGVLKEYVIFDGSQFLSPTAIGKIDNQNLHALPQANYLIITNNEILPQAERLANIHRNKYGTSVNVVTIDKIYNEFSSGGQDIGGIRNFIRMFYDRGNGTNDLQNVLLFGTSSFDFKNRVPNNTNVVPSFQSDESESGNVAYVTDEYFSLLDDGESVIDNNSGTYVDVGTGRIPSRNLLEAQQYVDKLEHYISPQAFGEWKTNSTFVTDDFEPGMGFLKSSETMSGSLNTAYNIISSSKLLADASPKVATPSGYKFPSITRDINNQIFNGTFLMNYIGHGNPTRWAVEEILYQGDIDLWSNFEKLPIVITATCDFGRYDNPYQRASGVDMVIKKNGGAIISLTTTQIVYPGPNDRLNAAYINEQFSQDAEGKFLTFGEAFMRSKNIANSLGLGSTRRNSKNFVILGDPAIRPALPSNKVVKDEILERAGDDLVATDTFKALGRYVLKGHVTDFQGNVKNNFNGQVYVTVFDKEKEVSVTNPTLLQNAIDTNKSYLLQNSVLFKGNTLVENGEFTIDIILPKDINYDLGKGKITFYAFDNHEEAASTDTNFYVGGFSEYAGVDNEGPIVKPYIDNNLFRSGDIVSPNPMLYVELEDENGINVSGSSVGHDLIAIIDGDYSNPYILNSFYRTLPNDFTKGNLFYQLSRLEPGKHTLTVRAWDVYNNSGEGSIDFEVVASDGLDFNLYNFPNPFSESTQIVFQHNQPNVPMDVSLKIFASNGQMVFNEVKNIQPTGSFSTWTWNGESPNGAPVGNGVYLCQLSIKTNTGISKTLYHKIVFVR